MESVMFAHIVFFLCVFGQTYCQDREFLQTLQVDNGGQWGDWSKPDFCPEDEFVIGYQMRVEKFEIFSASNDDTALNTVKLICASGNETTETITSGEGFWGDWTDPVTCNSYNFVKAFALQVEEPGGDDTAANWIKFMCGQIASDGDSPDDVVLNAKPGSGDFGTWSEWSHTCQHGTAVCGLATKVEARQGDGDDTALNDVRLYCCEVSPYRFVGGLFG